MKYNKFGDSKTKMENKNKKKINQKDETRKIEFNDILMEITDKELIDYYTEFPVAKLEELLKSDIPEQDERIIKKILKS